MSTLRETLFDETLEQINLGDEIAINTSTFSLGSEIGISIGGTFGTNGQVLTTNGSVVYWGAGGSSSNAYVQNTDSRVLSGNLNFTGTNVYFTSGFFVGSAFSINTTALTFLSGGIYANGSLGSAGQVLASNGSSLYWSSAGGTGTVTNVASGNGLTGGPITGTGTLAIVANSGLTVNTTGIFVNPGNNQIVANSTGLWVIQSRISANNADYLGGTAAADYVKYTDSRTLSGNLTFNGIATFQSNLVVGALMANGGLGTAGQYLASNGTSTYWVTPSTGSVSQVNTGSGLTGGPVTTTGTISVVANSGLVANSTGVFVNPGNNQLIANSTGLWVDQTKIDHNTLVNYDSNRHIDHTGVSISAGSGLTGGGTIAATRTLSVVANSGLVANSTGVFVAALSGLSANSTGLYVVAGNTQLVSNVTGLWLDQTQIDHDVLTNYATNEHVDHSGVTISGGNGLTGGGDITASRTISVAGNNGIIANSTGVWVNPGTGVVVNATGVHVNATYIGTITANASLYANFASYVPANTGIVSNATGVFVNASYIGTIAANSATYLGGVTANSTVLIFANTIGIFANGSIGTAGQVLSSNGSVIYWADPTVGGGGTVTQVNTGSGLTGGSITTTGTISVVANSGITANATGLFVDPSYIATLTANLANYVVANTGLISNSTGVFVNAAYIGTLAANSATYLGTVITANSTTLILANTIGVFANGSAGTSGQVLTSNGSVVYWANAASGGGSSTRVYSVTTATAGQNTFTVSPGYATGFIDVYYNGVHLNTSDFTEVNSTAIQLGLNCLVGDIIELVGIANLSATAVTYSGNVANGQIMFLSGGTPSGTNSFTFDALTSTMGLANVFYTKYVTATTTGATTQTIDNFVMATYRSAKYYYNIKDNNANNYQSGEIMVLHNAGTPYITEYGCVFSNSDMGAFTAIANTTDVILQFTPVSTNTTIRMSRTLVTV